MQNVKKFNRKLSASSLMSQIFAIGGTEWIWVTIIVVVIAVWYVWWVLNQRKKMKIESRIISIISSRGGAGLDDIIIATGLSSEEASKIVQKLVSSNILKTVVKENKTIYISA